MNHFVHFVFWPGYRGDKINHFVHFVYFINKEADKMNHFIQFVHFVYFLNKKGDKGCDKMHKMNKMIHFVTPFIK